MPASNVLVLNSGSSSLKFAVIEPNSGTVLRTGLAERLNSEGARWAGSDAKTALRPHSDHAQVLEQLLSELGDLDGLGGRPIAGVGHRVVHGGERFAQSVRLDAAVIREIRACAELAPLHNPANLLGIEAAQRHFAELPQVAVFDTAFHQTLPAHAYLYAIPYELYEQHKIRRYGFHGTSHRYVAHVAAERLGRPLTDLGLVTAHLGNGCSACAIQGGRSVDTSMGFTPLEGLVMGTRSGDVDPNLHQFLVEHTGATLEEVTELLNRRSGLLGLSGASNDMRTLVERREASDARATLAIQVFCYRLAKGILALTAGLERLDALIFTGGIGENAASVRAETLGFLRVLGASVDPELNRTHGSSAKGRITEAQSRLLSLVIPTNEELVIAREVARFLAVA
jgi:acetate kinase